MSGTTVKPDAGVVAEALRKLAAMVECGFVTVLEAEHGERSIHVPTGEYHVYDLTVAYGMDSELPEEVRRALGIRICEAPVPVERG